MALVTLTSDLNLYATLVPAIFSLIDGKKNVKCGFSGK